MARSGLYARQQRERSRKTQCQPVRHGDSQRKIRDLQTRCGARGLYTCAAPAVRPQGRIWGTRLASPPDGAPIMQHITLRAVRCRRDWTRRMTNPRQRPPQEAACAGDTSSLGRKCGARWDIRTGPSERAREKSVRKDDGLGSSESQAA
jgi:hypothetical protein